MTDVSTFILGHIHAATHVAFCQSTYLIALVKHFFPEFNLLVALIKHAGVTRQ